LTQEVQLHGGEDFICAQVHYVPGRFLVFLKRNENLLVGSNWHFSVRPIDGEDCEWFDRNTTLSLSKQPLPLVLKRIEQLMNGFK
jgi:hypothetical protein